MIIVRMALSRGRLCGTGVRHASIGEQRDCHPAAGARLDVPDAWRPPPLSPTRAGGMGGRRSSGDLDPRL